MRLIHHNENIMQSLQRGAAGFEGSGRDLIGS